MKDENICLVSFSTLSPWAYTRVGLSVAVYGTSLQKSLVNSNLG